MFLMSVETTGYMDEPFLMSVARAGHENGVFWDGAFIISVENDCYSIKL